MNRIDARFKQLKERGEAAFIPYIVCGDPDIETTAGIVRALAAAGADVIELGVPFSDPVADGTANQEGALRALKHGTCLNDVIQMAGRVRADTDVPMILFTYFNPVYAYGMEAFVLDCADAGLDGVLCVDLPPEEAGEYCEWMHARDLATVFLVAPTSTPARIRSIAEVSKGFIYYVSRTGVTGEQDAVETAVRDRVIELKRETGLPVAVGFGISKPEHAVEVAGYADGVVVGSAIVRYIGVLGAGPDAAQKVAAYVQPLIEAAKSVGRRGAPR